jgi:hypothetical protein
MSRFHFFAPLFFLEMVVFSGCVSDFMVDGTGESQPVVNCLLTNDSIQTLTLTQSVSVGDGYVYKEIPEAKISLSVGDSLVGTFSKVGYSAWKLSMTPSSDEQYTLTVVLSDSTVLTATTTMPSTTVFRRVESADVYPARSFSQDEALLPVWIFIINSDRLLLEGDLPAHDDQMNEMIGTDHPLADRFNQWGEFSSLLPEAQMPPYNYYVRISSDSLSTERLSFQLETTYTDHAFVFFRTASSEYDRYLKTSLQKISIYSDETDPVRWFDESAVFSNINHGVGIFAAYSDQIVLCNGW